MVESIATPSYKNGAKKAKVSGDIRAIVPGCGKAVLCEVKARDKRLSWSDFEAHQHKRLREAIECSAVALVVWVSARGIFVFEYNPAFWTKGRGIGWEEGEALDLNPRTWLEDRFS